MEGSGRIEEEEIAPPVGEEAMAAPFCDRRLRIQRDRRVFDEQFPVALRHCGSRALDQTQGCRLPT